MTTTRFAPSPTGWIHIGNLRAALFNYAIARQNGGKFILRIDDTDLERSKQEYIDGIKEDLTWLGITWDQEESQSARFDRYAEACDQLIAAGRIYECFETPIELDLKRKKQLNMGKPPVYDRAALLLSEDEKNALRAERGSHWRFKLDQTRIEWEDGILGPISIDAASVSDPVIIKNDGQWLYTFASVVDDMDMGVSDIVRGADHVTNTATQIQMFEALGGAVPRFAHHSLLTGPQGEGLSKRLGTLSIRDLRAKGLEPMAVLSLMARLGSSDPIELRGNLDEIVANFRVESFGAAPTKFDEADLWPLTARVLNHLPYEAIKEDVAAAGVPDDVAESFWTVVRENIAIRADIAQWWPVFAEGDKGVVDAEDVDFVREALALLPDAPYGADSWANWLNDVKAATGRKGKGLFMPLRKALTGREHGPDMAHVLPLFRVKPAPKI